MKVIRFTKRKLGNSLTQPFGIAAIIFCAGILIDGATIRIVLLILPLLLGGLLFAFGREMTEINMDEKYYRQYYQLFIIKTGKSKPLPDIHYILIRDYHTKVGYDTMSDDADFYEVSFVTSDEKKLILAFSQSRKKVNRIVLKLKTIMEQKVIDRTKKQIVDT